MGRERALAFGSCDPANVEPSRGNRGFKSLRVREKIPGQPELFVLSSEERVAAADREFDHVVDRLVLDSPVLDWYETIAANCARVGLPPQAGGLTRPWLRWGALA
jgi:hypothetical protein